MSNNVGPERTRLNFAHAVSERFSFLEDFGFSRVELLPTIARYKKGDIEIDVYHGRQSYELGFGISLHGIRYSLGALIRAIDPEVGARYRDFSTMTSEGVMEGLMQLEGLVKQYGNRALRGDPAFYAMLENQRKAEADGYALGVLAEQLRPKAEAAFRQGNYQEAAVLYEKIRPCLTANELKKLELATKRSGV